MSPAVIGDGVDGAGYRSGSVRFSKENGQAVRAWYVQEIGVVDRVD
jgi:hypothetical protein